MQLKSLDNCNLSESKAYEKIKSQYELERQVVQCTSLFCTVPGIYCTCSYFPIKNLPSACINTQKDPCRDRIVSISMLF